MVGLLTVFLAIVSLFLGIIIYIQQGKGGVGGVYGMSQSQQALFGGSGGQNFFEKVTWVLGILFIVISLGISILKTTTTDSRVRAYKAPIQTKK